MRVHVCVCARPPSSRPQPSDEMTVKPARARAGTPCRALSQPLGRRAGRAGGAAAAGCSCAVRPSSREPAAEGRLTPGPPASAAVRRGLPWGGAAVGVEGGEGLRWRRQGSLYSADRAAAPPVRVPSLPPSFAVEGGGGGGRYSPVPSPPVGRAEAVREALSGLPSPTALAVVADTRAAGSCGREAETSLGGAGAGPEAGRGCCAGAGAGKVAVKRTALPPLPSEFPALLHPLLGRPPGSEARSNAAQRGRCGTATAATVAPFIPFLLANRCISGKAFQHFLENIPISFNLGSEHKFPYDSDHFIRRLFLSKDTWKAVRQLKHPSHLDGPRVTSRGLESACSRLANHLPPSPAVTAAGRRPGRSEPDSERSDSVTLPLPWIESWALWPPSAVLTNPAT